MAYFASANDSTQLIPTADIIRRRVYPNECNIGEVDERRVVLNLSRSTSRQDPEHHVFQDKVQKRYRYSAPCLPNRAYGHGPIWVGVDESAAIPKRGSAVAFRRQQMLKLASKRMTDQSKRNKHDPQTQMTVLTHIKNRSCCVEFSYSLSQTAGPDRFV